MKAVHTTFGPGAEPIEGGSGWADVKEYVDERDELLQDQIDTIEASDVESVAGVSPVGGDVPVADLLAALGLDTSALGVARSTDGSFGLPVPTGVGFEWVITANEIDGPYMNGVGL